MRVAACILACSVLLSCVTPDEQPELSSTEQALWSGEIKTLVLMAEFAQNTPHATVEGWAEEQLNEFDTFIRANSYDRAWIEPTYRGIYLLSPAGCHTNGWDGFNDEKILRETALLADPTTDFSEYDLVIVLSKDDNLCPPGNSGTGPGAPVPLSVPTAEPITGGWIRMRLQSLAPSMTYAHEFGHVMNAWHMPAIRCTRTDGSRVSLVHSAAQGTCVEQPPFTDLIASEPLGGRYTHYSAAHKHHFGWLNAATEVVTTNGGVYTLTPVSLPNGLKLIEIPLTGSTRSSYTLEYRQPVGYDANTSTDGPTLSGVFMHAKRPIGGGWFVLDAVDLPPFETGQIQLTALPLASPRPGGGYEPSYIDPVQNIAIYVYSMSSSGAVVGVYQSTNWARYNNGGVVYAPSQWSANHSKSMANNGTRTAAWWGGWWQLGSAANVGGGCWNPSTWMYVGFNGVKTIHQVDVIGLQDNFSAQTEPYLGQTSYQFGLRHFHVQYWAPTFQWVDVPGGYITWNNQVWNRLTFAPVSTQYVRVWIECAMDNYARVVELEAYGW